jgi:hypothetical protein
MSTPGSDSRPSPWVVADRTFAQLPGIDPDLEWALGSGRQTFFKGGRQRRWISVLVEVQGVNAEEFAAGTGFLDDGPSRTMWQASVRVLDLYDTHQPDSDGITFLTAMVSQGFFEFLKRNDSLQKIVIGLTLSLPLGSESLGPSFANSNSGNTAR